MHLCESGLKTTSESIQTGSFKAITDFFARQYMITPQRNCLHLCTKSIWLLALFDDEITSSPLLDCMWLLEVENIAQVITNLIHNTLKPHRC